MDVSGWEEEEVLLAGEDGIEILIVVLVEGGVREMVADPQVNGFREATKSFRRPGDVGLNIGDEGRVLGNEAIVLLLRVRHQTAAIAAGYYMAEGVRKEHALNMRGGEAEVRGGRGHGGEGIGATIGSEVEGDGRVAEGVGEVGVGPAVVGEGRPV